MSKIDYSAEYREFLDALLTRDRVRIATAARALGVAYSDDYVSMVCDLDDHFIIKGTTAETATCILRDENETY